MSYIAGGIREGLPSQAIFRKTVDLSLNVASGVVKFMPEGGNINLEAFRQGDSVMFKVRNSAASQYSHLKGSCFGHNARMESGVIERWRLCGKNLYH